MDRDVTSVDQFSQFYSEPKVHDAICCELMKVSKKIYHILPSIESSRPGNSSGIQVLCSLNNTVQKIKLLVLHCSESSKLYLALTTESISSRCERIRTQLNQCLCQIQTMVPPPLFSQIAEVIDYIKYVKFIFNPDELEAEKVLLNLLAHVKLKENQEFESFQIAASRLKITSSSALLVERRAIKKLLDNFQRIDSKKERILKYFLYLIKKHGRQLRPDTMEQIGCLKETAESESFAQVQSELFNGNPPPEEFFCPISSELMFDPVVISSGQTYERIFVKKWFDEGNNTCPKTKKKLENLSVVSNSCMKELIISWCKKHGVTHPGEPCTTQMLDEETSHCSSISSLKNISTALLESEQNLSSLSIGSCCSCSDSSPVKVFVSSTNCRLFLNYSQDDHLRFLSRLFELPAVLQEKVVKEIKNILEGDEETLCSMLYSGFAEALMVFLKKACSLCDLDAQRSGAQILLSLVTDQRWDMNFQKEDAIQFLSSLFDCGIDNEALMILHKAALLPSHTPRIAASDIPAKIIRFLNTENHNQLETAMKILSELSSHRESTPHFLSARWINKIALSLSKNIDNPMSGLCLNILRNLVGDDDASLLIAYADGCIASLAEALESGVPEQEMAAAILLSLCSRSAKNCFLVLKEGVIPPLVNVSMNGNTEGREIAAKLLQVLRDFREIDCMDSSQDQFEANCVEIIELPVKNSRKLASKYSRPFGFFSRKMKFVSKSLAIF